MSFSFLTKNVTSFVQATKHFLLSFLLMETGDYILLEDGGRIILEESIPYTYQSKNTS